MKQRRPEKFSDSTLIKKTSLNRLMLEYKLEKITSNSDEQAFQNFCVKVAQHEIAPNLRVQTGPTGGGDSKADSETYPVSLFTSLGFWEGLANAEGERWAIAISAKQQWQKKIRDDVAGIMSTNRGYKKIFFITNQFARDRTRAQIEDELAKKYSVPVVILDRNWLLDRVFANQRQKLAIDELHLGDDLLDETLVGPNDSERQKELDSINKQIDGAFSGALVNSSIAGKALQAALLARGLEKPRAEVDGLFDRAIRIAEMLQSSEAIYSAKYFKAWTTFFWYEDYLVFLELFNQLEELARDTTNIDILELQFNLCRLLFPMPKQKGIPEDFAEEKRLVMRNQLTVVAEDDMRPSAAVQAGMLLAFDELMHRAAQKANVDTIIEQMKDLLKKAERLIGFHYEETIAAIHENFDVFSQYPKYEELINLVLEIDTKRKGDLPTARRLMDHGLMHLEAERYIKAIDYLGRSLVGLYKEESKGQFIYSLYFISFAYEAIGLLWAARGSLIHAASYAVEDLKKNQIPQDIQFKCCRRLKMIELRLGRIGYMLEWHQADMILAKQWVTSREQLDEVFVDATYNFSALSGCLLLKTNPKDLLALQKVPDVFKRLHLDTAAMSLLYLLGGEVYLDKELLHVIAAEGLDDFFLKWASQSARKGLPDYPNYGISGTSEIESNILGTRFLITSENSSPGIEICEMIASALEAFLSTALSSNVRGKVSEFKVLLVCNEKMDAYLQLSGDESNGRNLKVFYRKFNPHSIPLNVRKEIDEVLLSIVIRLVVETMAFENIESGIQDLMGRQQADERSFNFLSPIVVLGNVLGHNPKRNVIEWVEDGDFEYVFDGNINRIKNLQSIEGADNDEIGDKKVEGHRQIRTVSIINDTLWDGHTWRGFGFAVDRRPYPIIAPTLFLLFDDRHRAVQIFKEWNEDFGALVGERISISILIGINASQPHWYKGMISADLRHLDIKQRTSLVLKPVISTMTPDRPGNLEGFLESFKKFGYFKLAPVYVHPESGSPEVIDGVGFEMRMLTVKNAWEIGVNDVEMAAIQASDMPLVPDDVPNAPVLEVLRLKRTPI